MPPCTHALIYRCRLCGRRFDIAAPEEFATGYSEAYTQNFYPDKFTPALEPVLSGRYLHPHGKGEFGIGDLVGIRKLSIRELAERTSTKEAKKVRKRFRFGTDENEPEKPQSEQS